MRRLFVCVATMAIALYWGTLCAWAMPPAASDGFRVMVPVQPTHTAAARVLRPSLPALTALLKQAPGSTIQIVGDAADRLALERLQDHLRIALRLQTHQHLPLLLETQHGLGPQERAAFVRVFGPGGVIIPPQRVAPPGQSHRRRSQNALLPRAVTRPIPHPAAQYGLNPEPQPRPLHLDPSARYTIEVSVSQCLLWLYRVEPGGRHTLVRTFPVATAKRGVPYPKGNGVVTAIDLNPSWKPTPQMVRRAKRRGKRLRPQQPGSKSNPMGSFKIHLSHGPYYRIHGTNKPGEIGKRVSQGCVRMHNDTGKAMAEAIRVGTPVRVFF